MVVELQLSGQLSATIAQTDLAPGKPRAESNHRLYFTFSHLSNQHITPAGSPVISVSVAEFNASGGNGLKLRWPGLRGLEGFPADTMLLVNLVAETITLHHEFTEGVVATGCTKLSNLLSGDGPTTISLRDRAMEGILAWGLQEGGKPSAQTASKAVDKGTIIIENAHFTSGGPPSLKGKDTISWSAARQMGHDLSQSFLDTIATKFSRTPVGVREAISYNMPFYAHHYPPSEPVDGGGGDTLSIPSFVCFNKPPVYASGNAGVRHALIKLLRISLHNQHITPARFVHCVKQQLASKTDQPPPADFYRCMHAGIGAVTLPALCRPYRYDGSCIRTTVLMPQLAKVGGASASAADRFTDSLAERLDSQLHMMSDQLAIWGEENNLGLDCEDGCNMARQLVEMVRQEFGTHSSHIHDAYSEEGSCWASLLELMNEISTRNYCQPAGTAPISHILLVLGDQINVSEAEIRGCHIYEQRHGQSTPIDAMVFRLQEFLRHHTRPWVRHLGYFAAETTLWQTPSLTTADLSNGPGHVESDGQRTLDRLKLMHKYISGKYKRNTALLRDFAMPLNHFNDVYANMISGLTPNQFRELCLVQPHSTRLYPFYHVITNGDLSMHSPCQPGADEPDGLYCTSVVFNSLLDEQPMQCGTFLQRIALEPEKAVLVPTGIFVSRQQLVVLQSCCNMGQWPSLYFIRETLQQSQHEGVDRLPHLKDGRETDVFMATEQRRLNLGPLVIKEDPMPPVNEYHPEPHAPVDHFCLKLMLRSGTALSTNFAGLLLEFLRNTPVDGFKIRGFDYIRYDVAETLGPMDSNYVYVVRVFVDKVEPTTVPASDVE